FAPTPLTKSEISAGSAVRPVPVAPATSLWRLWSRKRSFAMRHARSLRRLGGVIVARWGLGSAGCSPHHYYGNVTVCPPLTTVPSAVSSGSVCEVPTNVNGGTLLGAGQGRTTIVSPYSSNSRPPKVVVSEPRRGLRGGWQRADPDASLATTRVEGEYDDTT